MLKTSIVVLALAASQLAVAGGDPYPTAACDQQLVNDARLKMLGGKVAFDFSGEVASSLRRVATLPERAALGVWAELRQECFALGSAHRAAAHPALPVAADHAFVTQQKLLGELRDGRFGYNEFNVRSLELRQSALRRQAQILDPDQLHNAALR